MKTIFTFKERRYSYKIVDGKVKTYEILGLHEDEIDAEKGYEPLTDKDWEEIAQYCEALDKEL